MNNALALLEELLVNGNSGYESLYAWFLAERDLIEDTIKTMKSKVVSEEYYIPNFTCPKCGSHFYGSSSNDDGTLTRQCHGEFGCDFEWHQKDDKKYLRES